LDGSWAEAAAENKTTMVSKSDFIGIGNPRNLS
jgi:hypothetical protein